MEIMNTSASSLCKLCTLVCCLLLATAAASLASELILQKAPSATANGQDITFALVNYNANATHAEARALYVSSGADLKKANNMVDGQPATSYAFSAKDAFPTAVIDLGESRTLRRVSATFSAQKGSIAVYVLPSLPESGSDEAALDLPNNLKVSSEALSTLTPVGLVEDDGSRGQVAVDFPAATGRYVMIRWNPAVKQNTALTVAEVAAFGGNEDENVDNAKAKTKHRYNDVTDSKEIADSKQIADTKDVPAEGPEAPPPAEGPPPGLPPPPPFTFIPQIVPVSP
jgi:hypothetical protein